MTQPELQIKRVHEKLILLVRQHQSLQKENERLKEEVRKIQEYSEGVARESDRLRQQTEVLKLSGREMGEPDKKMLEKRLSQYVREIDKCIALLQD
jgi:5-methylcytosine-specific restriction endonuclease McrBC GTP-binding regulatory subunit McrB